MPRGGKRQNAGRKPKAAQPKTAPVAPALPQTQPEVPPTDSDPLSAKELLFVECYTGVSEFNASDAYRRAGFKADKRGALASRLIGRDRVAAAIRARLSKRIQTLAMDGDEALEGISRIARADIRKVLNADGNIQPINELDDDTADAIASIKVVERRIPDGDGGFEVEYTKEFKFYDKLRARELMAKAAGKLTEKHEVKHTVDPLAEAIRQDLARHVSP